MLRITPMLAHSTRAGSGGKMMRSDRLSGRNGKSTRHEAEGWKSKWAANNRNQPAGRRARMTVSLMKSLEGGMRMRPASSTREPEETRRVTVTGSSSGTSDSAQAQHDFLDQYVLIGKSLAAGSRIVRPVMCASGTSGAP